VSGIGSGLTQVACAVQHEPKALARVFREDSGSGPLSSTSSPDHGAELDFNRQVMIDEIGERAHVLRNGFAASRFPDRISTPPRADRQRVAGLKLLVVESPTNGCFRRIVLKKSGVAEARQG
jgi:hypothetical protein